MDKILHEKTDIKMLRSTYSNWKSLLRKFNDEEVYDHMRYSDVDAAFFIALLLRYTCYYCGGDFEDAVLDNVLTCCECGLFQHKKCPDYEEENTDDEDDEDTNWLCHLCNGE